ncbi:MAG: hypothetical protein LAP87_06615 [Acidobacteriia bacterium]|nr:hypothetical protein [Terriglobia bacterium]
MPIEIGGIEIARVHRIATVEQAAFVAHRVPGLEGDLVQNLGRGSVRLTIEGICYGPAAADDLEKLHQMHRDGQPVDFLADIVGQSYFSQVIIERFEVRQAAGGPDEYGFAMLVAEYVISPEPEAAPDLAAVDADIADQAQSFMEAATLPDMLGGIPNLDNPLAPLGGALDGVKTAMGKLGGAAGSLESLFGKG